LPVKQFAVPDHFTKHGAFRLDIRNQCAAENAAPPDLDVKQLFVDPLDLRRRVAVIAQRDA